MKFEMDSSEEMYANYLRHLAEQEQKELAENADTIGVFTSFCAEKGIVLTNDNFSYVQTVAGVVATYPGIAEKLVQDLTKDKDGLFDFKQLCSLYERRFPLVGYLCASNFMLMAHPYFRRGYADCNGFAPRFIDIFWRLKSEYMEPFIALDPDRVRITMNARAYMEKDFWFGSTFNKDIKTIADGITKYRPALGLDDYDLKLIFNNAYSLDIKWSTKGNIKTFQAEEFKTDKVTTVVDGEEYFPSRYIHAEFDLTKGCFQHFDGAIHFYDLEEYCTRRDSDFNYNAKNNKQIKTKSMKVFKINGMISIEQWTEFTSHFFTANPLVSEYFEGKYPDHIINAIEKMAGN